MQWYAQSGCTASIYALVVFLKSAECCYSMYMRWCDLLVAGKSQCARCRMFIYIYTTYTRIVWHSRISFPERVCVCVRVRQSGNLRFVCPTTFLVCRSHIYASSYGVSISSHIDQREDAKIVTARRRCIIRLFFVRQVNILGFRRRMCVCVYIMLTFFHIVRLVFIH